MRVVDYKPEHLLMVTPQASQQRMRDAITPEHARLLAEHPAQSLVDGPYVLMCGGLVDYWNGRALAWSVLDALAAQHMLAATRAALAFFDTYAPKRVEMAVDVDYAAGHRWAMMLGFELEAPRMRAYHVDGSDASLYARVR